MGELFTNDVRKGKLLQPKNQHTEWFGHTLCSQFFAEPFWRRQDLRIQQKRILSGEIHRQRGQPTSSMSLERKEKNRKLITFVTTPQSLK